MKPTKRCPRCGETKPVDEFHRDRSAHDGLTGWCASCRNEHGSTWREEHGAEWKARRDDEKRRAEFEDFGFGS